MKLIRTVLLLCLAFVLPSAGAGTITLNIGRQTIYAEVVDTPQSRERGLMQRDHLCANCGMLFVFENPGRPSFWMKDTTLPLAIAFIAADGTIINIEEMQPDTTGSHVAQNDALYALEMNRNWFAKNGIRPDDKVRGIPQTLKAHRE